jgi:hypothetical protein
VPRRGSEVAILPRDRLADLNARRVRGVGHATGLAQYLDGEGTGSRSRRGSWSRHGSRSRPGSGGRRGTRGPPHPGSWRRLGRDGNRRDSCEGRGGRGRRRGADGRGQRGVSFAISDQGRSRDTQNQRPHNREAHSTGHKSPCVARTTTNT